MLFVAGVVPTKPLVGLVGVTSLPLGTFSVLFPAWPLTLSVVPAGSAPVTLKTSLPEPPFMTLACPRPPSAMLKVSPLLPASMVVVPAPVPLTVKVLPPLPTFTMMLVVSSYS